MAKTAIITGGSRGLGAAMTRRLGKMGYNIVLNYHSDSSEKLAKDIVDELSEKYGVDGLVVKADVSNYADCEALVKAAVEKFGDKIDSSTMPASRITAILSTSRRSSTQR